MVINIQDDILRLRAMGLLEPLLADRTTGKNILWATNAYAELGQMFVCEEEIREEFITGDYLDVIQPRSLKAAAEQSERTRKRGEVSTPEFIIKRMCDHLDSEWFQRRSGFWKTDSEGRISFPGNRTWKQYANNRRMEITCGEAPFITLRHSPESGEIIPLPERIGMLDRKLRAVNENASGEDEWLYWAYRALRASYGYEFQGDSLLLARIHVLMTFAENLKAALHRSAAVSELAQAVDIITWNLWQMDGLTGRVPYRNAAGEQLSLFQEQQTKTDCRIYNWRRKRSVRYLSLKGEHASMKFDFIIGNPPYQNELTGDSNTATPIYHSFMDASYCLSDRTMLITPARFLFNAGYTPKEWNKKMLNDNHLKVISYYANSADVFPSVDIKGGVVITYRDSQKALGPIFIFTPHEEVNGILKKVISGNSFNSITSIITTSFAYHFTKAFYEDNPLFVGRASKGHDFDIQSNTFSVFPEAFFDQKPDEGEYIRILGRDGSLRRWKYIKRKYVTAVSNLDAHKAFYAKATGTGQFGEALPEAILGHPGDGATVTFMSIGCFNSSDEAYNCVKYTKTKFARTLLSILKVTQDNTPGKWKYVPLQDFTPASDIDWSRSIPEIDQQLYAKYGLDETEIEFIESHVKEMV